MRRRIPPVTITERTGRCVCVCGGGVCDQLQRLQLLDIVDGRAYVRLAVRVRTVRSILGTIALDVRLVYAHGRLVVPQVVALLRVARIPVHIGTVVAARRTRARLLVVLLAVHVRVVVEGAVAATHRPAAPLILEVPVEACVGPVLGALVLQEERALLHPEALQVRVVGRLLGDRVGQLLTQTVPAGLSI